MNNTFFLLTVNFKEVIMKNVIKILFLISSVAMIMTSCAKEDDKAETASVSTGTGTTASGTITGSGTGSGTGADLTGTYSASWQGDETTAGCINNSTAITQFQAPTGTSSLKYQFIITGSNKYTESLQWYSDTACSTITGYFNKGFTSVTIGDAVSGLTAGSNPTKPTSAHKISVVEEGYGVMANTDGTLAYFTALGLTLTSGAELLVEETNPSTYYNIVTHGTVTGKEGSYLFVGSSSTSAYPSDWGSSSNVFWK